MCGGAHGSHYCTEAIWGLSPRVRGSRRGSCAGCGVDGPIPACAGEPRRPVGFCTRARAYPRVCGGARIVTECRPSGAGLSPRVRGSLFRRRTSCSAEGPIPACAGEPGGGFCGVGVGRAYPRVCGGADHPHMPRLSRPGLSPRVRGSHSVLIALGHWLGPIPACAGEPAGFRRRCAAPRAYPRVCGGAGAIGLSVADSRGLSPRVRGSLRPRLCQSPGVGPIPACAGEPLRPSTTRRTVWAYPRVCGGACGVGCC